MWSDIFPNLVIGLSVGLGGGLLLSVLLSGGSDRSYDARSLVTGAALAAMFSVGAGAVLCFADVNRSAVYAQAFEGVVAVVAAIAVPWTSRFRPRRGAVSFVIGFAVVSQQGVPGAAYLWSTTRPASADPRPLIGAALGLAAAVIVCWCSYQALERRRVPRTVAAAVVAAMSAGMAARGLGLLTQLSPWVPPSAFELNDRVSPSSALAELLRAVVGVSPSMNVAQVAGGASVLIATLVLITGRRVARRRPRRDQGLTVGDGPW